jgi:hypothetical protein
MTIFDVKRFLGSETSPENAGARLDGELICTMLRVLRLAGQILGPGHLRLHWKASSFALAQNLDDVVRDLASATPAPGTPISPSK